MKIGILTLPLHTNYGGILQAYALQTVLERMGHEVVVLDRPFHRKGLSIKKKITYYPKRFIKRYILFRKNVRILQEEYVERVQPIVEQNTKLFIDKYIHIRTVNNINTISDKEFDAIVVGSDQIWRPTPHHNIYDAYLEFALTWNIKKIAYAVSFGTDCWEYSEQETTKCNDLVKQFDGISVREESGIELCSKYLNVESELVLDPTLLLDKKDYMDLINNRRTKESHFLLVYILDMTEEKQRLVDKISKEKNLIPLVVNSKVENLQAELNERIQPPVENWIQGFCDADFVITDSFHACAFSIIFNKQFLVYGNASRGLARFKSLLSIFNLSNRFITSTNDYKAMPDINFDEVNRIMNKYREKSMSFLLKML